MRYHDFGEYVGAFGEFAERPALASRSFLKIERLNHREVQSRAYQTAHYLSTKGVHQGDRVMVVAANSPQWVELLLGSLLLGAVLVPVDVNSSSATILGFRDDTKPKIEFLGKNVGVTQDSLVQSYLLDDLDELIARCPCETPNIEIDDEGPALIVFTSGTTADPKGVVLTQRNVLANIEGILQRINVGEDWRLLSVLPLSHMYEMAGSLAILSRGASIFYMPRVTPLAISQALADYQINTILAIPQLLSLMLERIRQSALEEGKERSLSLAFKTADHLGFKLRRLLFHSVHARLGGHLNLVVTGGAPIPPDVAIAWEQMGVRMVQGYGLTETSPILTCNSLDERHLDSPGRALDNVELRIGEEGEIQAKGPSVFHEYWQNSSATRAAFTDDGWFRTGDVGRLENGWLHIQGRLKFAIVRASGLKVFPEDIEHIADEDSRFQSFCIVGVNGPKGESVTAVIISDQSDAVVAEAIAAINAQLASFQHIDTWRRWPESDFPRTRLLKIDRRLVQLWANASQGEPLASNAGVADVGDQLVRIIQLSLDDPNAVIRESDRLADIGLDSLGWLDVVATVLDELGIVISDEAFTPTTTVAQLRRLLETGSPAEAASRQPAWPYWRWVRLVGDGLRDGLLRALIRIWVKMEVHGGEVLDGITGPALFIFNHSDDLDGPVIYQALPPRIRRRLTVATADDVLRDHKVLAFMVRLCFAGFAFARAEPYMPSLNYVGKMVDRGWNVVVAPEGHISLTGELQPFKSGIGLLAVSLGLPVVPIKTIGLAGTVPPHAKWPKKRSRVTVRIGQPMHFDRSMAYEEVTESLHAAMEAL